jgi:hypothetical protein
MIVRWMAKISYLASALVDVPEPFLCSFSTTTPPIGLPHHKHDAEGVRHVSASFLKVLGKAYSHDYGIRVFKYVEFASRFPSVIATTWDGATQGLPGMAVWCC